MITIKNIEILKNIQINDWTISHVYKNYTNEIGKDYYIFQLDRTGGIVSTTISLEKEATHGIVNEQTYEKRMLYELKGPEGTINLYLSEIKVLGAFITKLKKVC